MEFRRFSATGQTRRSTVGVLGAFSVLATLSILVGLTAFDSRPGAESAAPRTWPRSSAIERSTGEAQLLVFVHPFCSCTSATIAELEYLHDRPSLTFLVARPAGDANWTWSELPEIRRGLPRAAVRWDESATEAGRFHATTSGTVLLYGSAGDLLFEGGVTESRGHQGDNRGLDELAASLGKVRGPAVGAKRFQVFGCTLWSPRDSALRKVL